jgi:hypothetical protein
MIQALCTQTHRISQLPNDAYITKGEHLQKKRRLIALVCQLAEHIVDARQKPQQALCAQWAQRLTA